MRPRLTDRAAKLRTIHVIAGLDAAHGGPSYSVPALVRALRDVGCDAETLTVGRVSGASKDGILWHRQDYASLPLLGALRLSGGLEEALLTDGARSDLIHNHGLWLMPNVAAGRISKSLGLPLVVSPRGMLSSAALRYSKFKKRLFWSLVQGPSLAEVAAWHATSDDEANDIRAFGLSQPIAVAPNGVDLPKCRAIHAESSLRRTILFLSRLHPKKGIPSLVEAWARIALARPEWELVIAGPDEGGHQRELEGKVSALGAPRVRFAGAIYGSHKEILMAESDLFVLPTENENFGISVAEALAAGLPAIVTKGAPWAGLETERCGWWIDHGVEPLAAALLEATALTPDVRREMGARGRAWMARDFGWGAVASQMIELYSWVLGRAERPSFVQ